MSLSAGELRRGEFKSISKLLCHIHVEKVSIISLLSFTFVGDESLIVNLNQRIYLAFQKYIRDCGRFS